MIKKFFVLLPLSVAFVAGNGCSDSPAGIDDPEVNSPTNLRAASADSAVLLLWTASRSEGMPNFGGYVITARNKAGGETARMEAPAGSVTARFPGLANGIRYSIVMRSVSRAGKLSMDSTVVEWSPAIRISRDGSGRPIRVYATTSQLAEGVNMDPDATRAELLNLSSQAFRQRGMFYVFAANFAAPLEITSAHLWALNPGQTLEFSNVAPVPADNLDEGAATSSPAASTYTLSVLSIDAAWTSKGRIYFGRVTRSSGRHYFRLLIKKSADNALVHGAGPDRHLEIEASYQGAPNMPFAK